MLAATPVSASIVFSDDFNSPDGTPLLGTTADVGGTWTITGTSVVNPLDIQSGEVDINNNGQDAYAAFSSSVPNAVPLGLLTHMDIRLSAANAAGDYFTHLSDPVGTNTNFYQRLFARSSGGGYQLGLLDTAGTGSATTWGSLVLSLGTNYHIDVLWNFVPGANNDTFAVYVNNILYLTHSWTSVNAEPAQVSAANIRQGTAANAPTLRLDNLRVERTPEPAMLLLGSIVGLLGIACRRHISQFIA
jgi:hypothetical protein